MKQRVRTLLARTPVLNHLVHAAYRRRQVRRRREQLQSALALDLFGPHPFDGRKYSVAHEPTIRCNLKCKMCYQQNFRDEVNALPLMNYGRELRTAELKQLYDRLNLRSIGLVGSEVFIRKDIFELLQYLQDRGVACTILTNGTLINERNLPALLTFRPSTERIIYSIDGPRDIHNGIRGTPDAFDKVCRAIELTRPYFNVSINTVILGDNLDHLEETVVIVKDLGLPTLNLTFEEVYTREEIAQTRDILTRHLGWKEGEFEISTHERDGFPYALGDLKRRLHEVRRFAESKGVFVNYTPYTWERHIEDYYHGTGHRTLQLVCPKLLGPTARIDHLGNVLFCGVLRKSWGNLLEKTFEEIWNAEDFREFRRSLLKGNMLPICRRCCKVDSLPQQIA